jgi:hypothetical protein
MIPHPTLLIAYILLGLLLFFIFNFFTILVYETLGLSKDSLLVGLILIFISLILFYMYVSVTGSNIIRNEYLDNYQQFLASSSSQFAMVNF